MTLTPPPTARLAFLTQPEPGVTMLNLQFERTQDRVIDVTADGQLFERVQITPEQLKLIAIDATKMAVQG